VPAAPAAGTTDKKGDDKKKIGTKNHHHVSSGLLSSRAGSRHFKDLAPVSFTGNDNDPAEPGRHTTPPAGSAR